MAEKKVETSQSSKFFKESKLPGFHKPSALSISINKALKDKKLGALIEIFNHETSLNFNFFDYEQLDGDDVELIANALLKNETITKLRFVGYIGDIGAKALGSLLTVNRKINELELLNCKIGSTGIKYLANGLKTNSTLSCLAIWGDNPFGDNGMMHLCAALDEHSSISNICISDESIGKSGWLNFGNALKTMPKLTHVELWENNFSDFETLQGIMKAFHIHVGIESLHLRKNKITSQSSAAISEMISLNCSLKNIEIWCFDGEFDRPAVNRILRALDKNSSLTSISITCEEKLFRDIETHGIKIPTHTCEVKISVFGGSELKFPGKQSSMSLK